MQEKMLDAINRVSQQMEMFNVHYITKLDEKFLSIMQIMTTIDANVKQLQERSQAWDIFTHHMNAWSDHIKSSDQKIEILRKSVDNLPLIENQLHNTDFKVQYMFEKVDLMNEKLNDIAKNVKIKQQQQQQIKSRDKSAAIVQQKVPIQEDFESTEILLRLGKIQRMLQSTCTTMRLDREFDNINSMENVDDIKSILIQINSNLEKFPLKEIKQTFHLNKKHDKTLEALAQTINHIDERTVRIFDTNSYQYRKMLFSYKHTEDEVLTFTNNANILLKKVERAMKSVENQQHHFIHVDDEKCNSTIADNSQLNEIVDNSEEVEDETMDQKGKCAR
jgi:hypothetical protein